MIALGEPEARRLAEAARQDLARSRSIDEAFEAVCVLLRAHLGPHVLVAAYQEREDGLWLCAQRGYARVIHVTRPGRGIFGEAFSTGRTIHVGTRAAEDPRFVVAADGIDACMALRVPGKPGGLLGIEADVPIDASVVRVVEEVVAELGRALARLRVSAEPPSPTRRLLRFALQMAGAHEAGAVLELTARATGELLGVDCVQVLRGGEGDMRHAFTWIRDTDSDLAVPAETLVAIAEEQGYDLAATTEEGGADLPTAQALRPLGIGAVVGIPLRARGELRGYVVGTAREPMTWPGDALAEVALLATHAAVALATAEAVERLGWAHAAVATIGDHVFQGQLLADGSYRDTYSGPHLDRLLGGSPAGGATPNEVWRQRVHPEDTGLLHTSIAQLRRGDAIDVEYRIVGFDGVTRWVRERTWAERPRDGTVLISGIVADVTERHETERRARAAEARYRSVVDAMSEGVLVRGRDGEMLAFNASAERVLGLSEAQLMGREPVGKAWRIVRADGTPCPDDEHPSARTLRGEGAQSDVVIGVQREDGSLAWISINTQPLLDEAGNVEAVVSTFGDITAQRGAADRLVTALDAARRANEQLEGARQEAERLARTDHLTGLANRRRLLEALEAELARGSRDGTTVGLILLDMDHFKEINDNHGHAAGDAALVEIASRIRGSVRAYDTVARWGGEEFAVLLPSVPGDEELELAAANVHRALGAAALALAAGGRRVTASVGAARAADGAEWTADALIDAADRALYAAKRAGRNRVRVAEPPGVEPPRAADG